MNQPDILHDKKERSDFFIALAVIALTAAFLLYYIYGPKSSGDLSVLDADATELKDEVPETPHIYESEEPLKEVKSGIVEAEAEVDLAPSENRIEEKVGALDEVVDQVKEGITTVDDQIDEVVEDVKEEGLEIVEEISEVTSEIVDEPSDVGQDVKEGLEAAKEEVQELIEDTKEEMTKIATPVSSSSSGDTCHISVGLYKDQANVDKILRKLKNAGFDAYTKSFPRSTQVGVYVTCQSNQAESILSEIRNDFARDAYIEEFK